MDLIMIPHALLIFYGALVLGCGSALGFIAGRNLPRKVRAPEPPDLLSRRVSVLERELEDTQAEMARLTSEASFLRELKAPARAPQKDDPDGPVRRAAA